VVEGSLKQKGGLESFVLARNSKFKAWPPTYQDFGFTKPNRTYLKPNCSSSAIIKKLALRPAEFFRITEKKPVWDFSSWDPPLSKGVSHP